MSPTYLRILTLSQVSINIDDIRNVLFENLCGFLYFCSHRKCKRMSPDKSALQWSHPYLWVAGRRGIVHCGFCTLLLLWRKSWGSDSFFQTAENSWRGGGALDKKPANQTAGACPAELIQFKYANVIGVAGAKNGKTMRENTKQRCHNVIKHLALISPRSRI